jgi:hypothetical protein
VIVLSEPFLIAEASEHRVLPMVVEVGDEAVSVAADVEAVTRVSVTLVPSESVESTGPTATWAGSRFTVAPPAPPVQVAAMLAVMVEVLTGTVIPSTVAVAEAVALTRSWSFCVERVTVADPVADTVMPRTATDRSSGIVIVDV